MKDKLIALLITLGFSIEGKADDFELTSEHVEALEKKAGAAVELEAAKTAAEADLKAAKDTLEAVTGERDKAKTDLEAATKTVAERDEKITALEAKVEELGKRPGAEVIDPAAAADDADANDWETPEVKAAAHNVAADAIFDRA